MTEDTIIEEGAQLLTNCKQLKMKAADGKKRLTDVANKEAGSKLQRLPSMIYWTGLGVWGIRRFQDHKNNITGN